MSVRRRWSLTLGTAAALIVTAAAAAPARADHQASVAPDGSWCFLGAWTSSVAMHLYTEDQEDIRLRIRTDRSARYECTFRGVPAFLAAADPRNVWETDWWLPTRTTVSRGVNCWRPGEEESGDNTARGSKIVVRPDGTVKLVCRTDGNYDGPAGVRPL